MRLEGNFYKVHTIDQIENNYKIEVELFADHPIYKGHFPQQAVVPGVCTLTIIKECLGNILSDNISFKSIGIFDIAKGLLIHRLYPPFVISILYQM